MIKFYNTLTRKKEIFKPQKGRLVKIFTCGPTVYCYSHIGNLRTYIFEDILKRVLEYNGYRVKHVMNITDVGHLVSDQDVGEDKIELAAKREKKRAKEIAKFYENVFKKEIKLLNIKEPNIWIRATETIRDQIELIKILEKKGFTYVIEDGVYFNSSKLKTYGRLWPKKMEILAGKRVKMVPGKKKSTDFALWKFAKERKEMVWNSPWGKGFPGWHTECVAMSKKFLGIPFDIHCGGVDHILIHHTNEIAQAEAAFGKILARFWLHGEFLLVEGKKMAKSEGNIFTLKDLIKRGYNPLAFRYFVLGANYRSKLNFTFKALNSSQKTLNKLYEIVLDLKTKISKSSLKSKPYLKSKIAKNFQKEFLKSINDDLNTPQALAIMWQLIGEEKISPKEKYYLLLNFNKIFALGFEKVKKLRIPAEVRKLVKEREKYRKAKNFKMADELREEIKKRGYFVEDTREGPKIKKIS